MGTQTHTHTHTHTRGIYGIFWHLPVPRALCLGVPQGWHLAEPLTHTRACACTHANKHLRLPRPASSTSQGATTPHHIEWLCVSPPIPAGSRATRPPARMTAKPRKGTLVTKVASACHAGRPHESRPHESSLRCLTLARCTWTCDQTHTPTVILGKAAAAAPTLVENWPLALHVSQTMWRWVAPAHWLCANGFAQQVARSPAPRGLMGGGTRPVSLHSRFSVALGGALRVVGSSMTCAGRRGGGIAAITLSSAAAVSIWKGLEHKRFV